MRNSNKKHDETADRLNAVLNWAYTAETYASENFDTQFVDALKEAYREYGRLSVRQEAALANILERFKIEVSVWS